MGSKKEFIFSRSLWVAMMFACAALGLWDKHSWPF
jgi:hypothetical protein